MASIRVFTSFDYDHDYELKNALDGQSDFADSPFDIADWSIKDPSPGWKAEARKRIRRVEQVAVICGQYTHTADGVSVEITIAREESKPYFFLQGRPNVTCTKPTAALSSDKLYEWTWSNLKKLIAGQR